MVIESPSEREKMIMAARSQIARDRHRRVKEMKDLVKVMENDVKELVIWEMVILFDFYVVILE